VGIDALLATDTDGSDGWAFTAATTSWPAGQYSLFAQAVDVVQDTSNPVAALVEVIDDPLLIDDIAGGGAGYSETGTWTTGALSGAFEQDYRQHAAGAGGVASWTFNGLVFPGGHYEVLATWVADAGKWPTFIALLLACDMSSVLVAQTPSVRTWRALRVEPGQQT
jgi:hypothetical protein